MSSDKLITNLVNKINGIENKPIENNPNKDILNEKERVSINSPVIELINLTDEQIEVKIKEIKGITTQIPQKAKYIVAFKGESEIKINLKACSLRTKYVSTPEIQFKLKLILNPLNDNTSIENYRQTKAIKELKDHDWEVFFK